MMKIYTKTGDSGETGLFRGPRVPKDAARVEAYGAIDELNAVLGVARSVANSTDFDALLEQIQNDLFALGAELATPDAAAEEDGQRIGDVQVTTLEAAIDRHDEQLPVLEQFILPGGTPLAAHLHLARTVCRRAERRLVHLARLPDEAISPMTIVYVNRLSDLLFVLARAANAAAGHADVPWRYEQR